MPTCPRPTLLPGHCCHTCPKGEARRCFTAQSRFAPSGFLKGMGKRALCTHPQNQLLAFLQGLLVPSGYLGGAGKEGALMGRAVPKSPWEGCREGVQG